MSDRNSSSGSPTSVQSNADRSDLAQLLEDIAQHLLKQADVLRDRPLGAAVANMHDVQEAILRALHEAGLKDEQK